MSISPVVKKETIRIATGCIALSAVMVAVFALCGRFDWPVLWGALLGTAYAILNFFLMAYTMQKSAESTHTQAKTKIQFSYTLRTLLMLVVGVMGMVLPCFNWISVLLPFIFPSITIYIMHILKIADPIPKNQGSPVEQDGGENTKQ